MQILNFSTDEQDVIFRILSSGKMLFYDVTTGAERQRQSPFDDLIVAAVMMAA